MKTQINAETGGVERKLRDYKHLDRDFRTKHKVFIFCLDESGSKINITERNRFNNIDIWLGGGGGWGCDWLCRVVGEALRLGGDGKSRRTYRGSNYQLQVECSTNNTGWFLKAMKIHNGTIRNIIVLVEYEFSGWVNFEKCLKSFFLQKIGKSSGNTSKSVRDQKQSSGKQIVMEESKAAGQTGSEQSLTVKLSSLAVAIFKQRSHISWGLVKEQMQKKLGRLAEVGTICKLQEQCRGV